MRSSWVALPLEENEGFGSIDDGFKCQNASDAIRMLVQRPILRLCMREEMMKRTKASDGVEGRRISALTPNSRCCCAELSFSQKSKSDPSIFAGEKQFQQHSAKIEKVEVSGFYTATQQRPTPLNTSLTFPIYFFFFFFPSPSPLHLWPHPHSFAIIPPSQPALTKEMPKLPTSSADTENHFPPSTTSSTDASLPLPAPPNDNQLSILTLNVWGLNYISKSRIPRIKAIASHLASSSAPHYDFVCLQEIWYESKDWRFLKQALSSRYPHSKFFYSGAFGSGLAILSRWHILETRTHPYSLNGQPIHVQHGDWFVGKACGCVTINHPKLGLVDVWNTHFVAAGGEDGPEYKRAHRITQAYELATNCRNSASRGRHVVCVGDLNSTPPSLVIGLLKNVGGMYDSFLDSHPELPEHATSLDAQGGGARVGSAVARPDPQRAIEELGVTCDSPLNSWTAGKPLDERATRGAGKRLDYILYRGPADLSFAEEATDPNAALSASLAYSASHSSRGRLTCNSSAVVVTDRVPGHDCSFSDHFGVESFFSILDTPAAESSNKNRKLDATTRRAAQHKALTSSLHALSGGFAASRSNQMSHFYVFGATLLLAIGLIVASIFQPLGGVNPVFVLLAVVAGWGGTTMLYSAVVWGEWEKRKFTIESGPD